MNMQIEPGHCWVSGKLLAEILSYYPNNHPLAGHVQSVGEELPECVKVTFLLIDGRQMKLRIHPDHIDEINLNDLWHRVLEAQQLEFTHRKYWPHYNEEKVLESHQNQLKLLCPPIGIVDIDHG